MSLTLMCSRKLSSELKATSATLSIVSLTTTHVDDAIVVVGVLVSTAAPAALTLLCVSTLVDMSMARSIRVVDAGLLVVVAIERISTARRDTSFSV